MPQDEKQDKTHDPEPSEEDLEREIRSRRRYSLAEAIGREASNLLKGASPVTRQRQAMLSVEQWLEKHLVDPEGALEIVLARRLRESEELLEGLDSEPLRALEALLQRLLENEPSLRHFLREVDAEWGRMYLEKPYFDRVGRKSHADDPYPLDAMRSQLRDLAARLRDST